MTSRRVREIASSAIVVLATSTGVAWAQEATSPATTRLQEKASGAKAHKDMSLCPEVDLLKQSISERLQAVAEKLGLTDEQRDKIKEIHRTFAAKRQELIDRRKDLFQNDIKAVGEMLSPEQKEKVNALMDERVAAHEQGDEKVTWAQESSLNDTFARKLCDAAEEIGLTTAQREQIKERLSTSIREYRDQRQARRKLITDEFKEIETVLTPEQRENAHQYFEQRMVSAPILRSAAQRLHAAAERLGLTQEQQSRIVDVCKNYDEKYSKLADERREQLRSELKAASEVLTPEQREKVRDYFQDHMVVLDVQLDPNDPQAVALLKETIAERLEATADKLGLTEEQRGKIKAICAGYMSTYTTQRDQRESLRKEELKAMGDILTPEQREKVQNFYSDRMETP